MPRHFYLFAVASLLTINYAYGEVFSTNFEFNNRSGAFTLFESPNQVMFEGGQSKVVGDEEIYRSGIYAYMFDNETVTINFETPVKSVIIYLKNQDPDINSSAHVYEVDKDEPVNSILGDYDDWTRLAYTSDVGITKIVGVNASRGYAAFEDLSFETFEALVPVAPEKLNDPIPQAIVQSDVSISLDLINEQLIDPIVGVSAAGLDDVIFIAEQHGKIWQLDIDSAGLTEVMSLESRVVTGGERGLLGLAFHPDFESNGLFYTHTSEADPSERDDGMADFTTLMGSEAPDHFTVIAEWTATLVDSNRLQVDPTSRRQLLTVAQPQGNHNGGTILFDSGANLLIGLGDGGGADDQGVGHPNGGNGQSKMNVLGSILRIDPLGRDSENGAYGVPADNPFVAEQNVAHEIYAFGVRNPFKMSLDKEDNVLYVADVGQNDIEEVNIVSSGDNLGWPLREGKFGFFNNGEDAGYVFDSIVSAEFRDPVASYDHDEGLAIISGHVYRGDGNSALFGHYVFGDFSGKVFFLNENQEIQKLAIENDGFAEQQLIGIGQDARNQLYFFMRSGQGSRVFRLSNTQALEPDPAPMPAPDLPMTPSNSGGGTVHFYFVILGLLSLWRQKAQYCCTSINCGT